MKKIKKFVGVLLCFIFVLPCSINSYAQAQMNSADTAMLQGLQSLYTKVANSPEKDDSFLEHIHNEAERIRARYGFSGGMDGSEYIDLTVVDTKETERDYDIVTFNCTAYCPCSVCCGKWANGITASGATATAGRTIAASKTYAFGTEIEINGVVYIVEDRGGAIKGNKLDIYFDSHSEALKFGRQQLEGRVYK